MQTTRLQQGAHLLLLLVTTTLALPGCFKHPNNKVSQMVCKTDNNCPTRYQCVKQHPADAMGKCVLEGTPEVSDGAARADLSSVDGAVMPGAGGAGGTSRDAKVADAFFDVPQGGSSDGGQVDLIVDALITLTCEVGHHPCGGKCVANNEISHCGIACSACPAPQGGEATCDGTSCGGKCPTGKGLCNGACIDKGASCAGSCPTGTHACNGFCLSYNDVTGCGSLCLVCPVPVGASNASCENDKCGFVCSSGYHACGAACVRDDNPSACGASCESCPSDPNGAATCIAGFCRITCNPSFHYCSNAGKCLKDSDPASCGTSCTPCSSITGGSATCTAGVCGGSCTGTQKLCNGTCIDANAACNSQCSSGSHNCNGVCVLDDSPTACGAECIPCPKPLGASSYACTSGGTCTFTCGPGYHPCGNRCAADDDATACGSLCKECPADPNGTPICSSGSCSVRCNSGWHSCDGVCVSNNDPATCGLNECSTACQAPIGGSVSCNGTACVPSCPPSAPQNCSGKCIAQDAACNGTCPTGQKFCSKSNTCVSSSGCCTAADCTATGVHTVATCTNNVCGSSCDATTSLCGTSCVDRSSDNDNCGTCGRECAVGQHCYGGACVCDASSCPVGCCSGSACVSGTSNSACGDGGVQCSTCNSYAMCSSRECVGCGEQGQPCCPGSYCSAIGLPGAESACMSGTCGFNCTGDLKACGTSGCFECCTATDCVTDPGRQSASCVDHLCEYSCLAGYMTCLMESPICNAFTYGFENGVTGGWTLASACTGGGNPTVSSAESHSGSRTLAINCPGSGLMRLQHNLCAAPTNKASIAGKTVSAWVYWDGPVFPIGDTTSGCELTVWISQASSGGQSPRVYKPVGGWHQMQKKVIDTLNPLQSVTIDCYVNSNWSGVMYVDDITVN